MSKDPRRWTEQRLEPCRTLYEKGMRTNEIGAKFGISGRTVAWMAWQYKWQRKVKPKPGGGHMVAVTVGAKGQAGAGEVAVTAAERAFNEQLRRTIANYWRAQGRKVELHVEEQGGDLLGIRSKSVNGVPVS